MLTSVLYAVGLMAVMGAAFGVILGFAAKKFAVEADPRIGEITGVLPGANCGACGFAGCANLAESIVNGSAAVDACPVGRAAAASKIAAIMGIEAGASGTSKVALVMCNGGREECGTRFEYDGIQTCQAANLVAGGFKSCRYGCLGLGDCLSACPFGAIRMNTDGIPEIDATLCTACGKCVAACPRALITLVPADKPVHVRCMSHAKGPDVRKTCKVGCIACGICVKNCPQGAITMTDFLARIDPDKCTSCGICIEKCPMKTISKSPETSGEEVPSVSA